MRPSNFVCFPVYFRSRYIYRFAIAGDCIYSQKAIARNERTNCFIVIILLFNDAKITNTPNICCNKYLKVLLIFLGSEFVAYTTDGVKVNGLFGILFKILAKRKDEIVNGTGGWIDIIAPDILKNLFSCDDLIFIFDKTFQQFSFSGCKVYLSVGRNSKILVELNCIGTKFKFTKFYRFFSQTFSQIIDSE